MKRLPNVVAVFLAASLLFMKAEFTAAQSTSTESVRKIITQIVPVYPAMARTMNLTGTVRLEAVVLADGKVKSVEVRGGHPVLAAAAEDALRAWKWEKAEHDSTEQIEFRFHP